MHGTSLSSTLVWTCNLGWVKMMTKNFASWNNLALTMPFKESVKIRKKRNLLSDPVNSLFTVKIFLASWFCKHDAFFCQKLWTQIGFHVASYIKRRWKKPTQNIAPKCWIRATVYLWNYFCLICKNKCIKFIYCEKAT